MSLSAALHAAVAVLRRDPDDLLPFYLLGTAVPVVARVFVLLGLAGAAASLAASARLSAVAADLASRDLEPPDTGAEDAAVAEWAAELAAALEPLLTPTAVVALSLGIVAALAVGVALTAAVAAGQVTTCDARLRGRRGLPAGIAGTVRHWRAFLAAYLLEAAVWVGATLVAGVAVAAAAAASPVAALAAAPVVLLAWLAVVVPARAVFAFVPVAIVVDEVGALAGVRRSAGYVRREPVGAAGYYAVALGSFVGFAGVAGFLVAVDAPAVAGVLAVLVVAPGLDLVKTGLYRSERGPLSPPGTPADARLREQASAGARRGILAVREFVAEAPALHALAFGVFVVGGVAGWAAAGPFVGAVETSISERLAGHVPPFAAAHFLANNWTVAASTAMAGLGFGVPTALALGSNGFLFGALARLEVEPAVLVAFVVPHGLVEIPVLVVSGALGGELGVAGWRAWRGRLGRSGLADAIERAFWVLVGLAVLLGVAGLIEGFFSPYYWRPFV